MHGLNRIHESKPPRQRDADIVDASEILIVITDGRPQPELDAAVKRAKAAHRTVIYLEGAVDAKKPFPRKSASPKPPSARAARKDTAWAADQGRRDKVAGKPCLKYKNFCTRHELPLSDASLQLWQAYQNAYRKEPQRVRVNVPPPKPKRRLSLTRGLTLSDPPTHHRKTVRRYDRVEPRKSDLSPENAALLMKVNQQDTLVDMVR